MAGWEYKEPLPGVWLAPYLKSKQIIMNTRYQEILAKATEDIMGVKVVNQERFAELLVRECSYIASMCSVEKKPIHPDILWEDMSETAKMVNHTTCQTVAGEILDAFELRS